MKKKYLIFAVISVTLIGIVTNFIFKEISRQVVVNKLKGNIYYTRMNWNAKLEELWTSNASLKNPKLLAKFPTSEDYPPKWFSSYIVRKDKSILYLYVNNDKYEEWELNPLNGSTVFIKNLSITESEKLFPEQRRTISSRGKLWIGGNDDIMLTTPSGKTETLLKYPGVTDGFFSGFYRPQWSPDGNYVIFEYDGHSSRLVSFLTRSSNKTYVLDLKTKKYYKYIEENNLLWQ